MIYLDNAATTPLHQEVFDAMMPYLKEQYGNPSSIHRLGRLASKGIEKARRDVSNLINSDPDEILFTSGGTESNNTAIFGVLRKSNRRHIITSSIEHDAILEPLAKLEPLGYTITYIPVDSFGMISADDLKKSISDKTALVTIMYANNEVGTIQPIQEISKICQQYNIPFHTDAVQAVGKVPIDVKKIGVDLMSISSHKINGPKGIGCLYVKHGLSIDPLVFGGGQESGMRSGTENVPNIVGFGTACKLTKSNLDSNIEYVKNLRDLLVRGVLDNITYVNYNGHPENRIPNNAHFTFLGISGEDLIIKLDEYGIAASTGSACSVRIQKESHVLRAMNFSHEQINGSLRLTLGQFNTKEEVYETVNVLAKVVKELRSVSPLREKYAF